MHGNNEGNDLMPDTLKEESFMHAKNSWKLAKVCPCEMLDFHTSTKVYSRAKK